MAGLVVMERWPCIKSVNNKTFHTFTLDHTQESIENISSHVTNTAARLASCYCDQICKSKWVSIFICMESLSWPTIEEGQQLISIF